MLASTELPELKILAVTDHNNCLHSDGDSSDDRIQAPQPEPKFVQSLVTATANSMPPT